MDRLSFYFLAQWKHRTKPYSDAEERKARVREHHRYMIYVHSKLMIVDDRYALFGSCNLNDRGLSGGGDSEINCGVWASHGQSNAAIAIKRFRRRVWREHWGTEIPGSDTPEHCATEADKRADANYEAFRTMSRGATAGHICRLPLLISGKGLTLQIKRSYAEHSMYLPDAPRGKNRETQAREHPAEWHWSSPGSDLLRILGWAE